MPIDVRDTRMRNVIDEDTLPERVATGFKFAEGPVWHPYEHFLLFSDVAGNRMLQWRAGGGVRTYRDNSGMANGNAYDRVGRLVTCEHATSRVSRTEPDGTITTVVDRYIDSELNSPNDVIVKTNGDIYFTDPDFGRREFFGVPRAADLPFKGVYRIDAKENISLLVDDFDQPNGLCFSSDETRLFVNDTSRMHIRCFPVLPDGLLGEGWVWATMKSDADGAPDGMKLDSQGNLFCCGPGGIHVFDPVGICLGVIGTPEVAANFTWGDDDLRSLFVCASTGLYRFRVKYPGLPSF